jgi:hypothetical protein
MAIGDVRILHVPSTSQFMNIIMKGLQTSLFSYFRSSLNIHSDYNFDCGGGGGCARNMLYYEYMGPRQPPV